MAEGISHASLEERWTGMIQHLLHDEGLVVVMDDSSLPGERAVKLENVACHLEVLGR